MHWRVFILNCKILRDTFVFCIHPSLIQFTFDYRIGSGKGRMEDESLATPQPQPYLTIVVTQNGRT